MLRGAHPSKIRLLIMKAFTYILSDLHRYHGRHGIKEFLISFFFHRSFIYTFWFRLAQSKIPLISEISKVILKLKSWKYGIQIPVDVQIGFGFYIGHGMSVVINPTATIGNNCNVSQFTTIGSNKGRAARIGDNVYIGPAVCIVEDVDIGSNSVVGAGSVVTRDVAAGTVVAGVPAKLIKTIDDNAYIHNEWKISASEKP